MKIKDKIIKMLFEKSKDIRIDHLKEEFGDLGFKTYYNIFSGDLITEWEVEVSDETRTLIKEYINDFDKIFLNIIKEIRNI